jgi:hypothetical protein
MCMAPMDMALMVAIIRPIAGITAGEQCYF